MIGLIQFEGIYFSPEKVNFIRPTPNNGVLVSFNSGYLKFQGPGKYEKIASLINEKLSSNNKRGRVLG
jgi:hypothetical protein